MFLQKIGTNGQKYTNRMIFCQKLLSDHLFVITLAYKISTILSIKRCFINSKKNLKCHIEYMYIMI